MSEPMPNNLAHLREVSSYPGVRDNAENVRIRSLCDEVEKLRAELAKAQMFYDAIDDAIKAHQALTTERKAE